MCMQRYDDGNHDRPVYSLRTMDIVDLTAEDMSDDDDYVEISSDDEDQWNYPYNQLPSSDEEQLPRGFIADLSNRDLGFPASDTAHDSSDEINQNTSTPTASNILETNNTNQSSEGREFEMNIPQILLSMARITNHLHNRTSPSHD